MDESPQVLRIFRARVKVGREEEWERVLEEQLVAERLGGRDGLERWYRGRPMSHDSREHVVVTIWRDRDAMRAFAGATARPVLFRNQADLADEITVEQYELA